jgi:hypothetical protein
MSRRFDRSELAFFAVPRTWREIEMRFGSEAKTEPFRDCIILADNEGGSGDLKYLQPLKSWVLTDAGKARAGDRLIARELRVYPDLRQQAREREAAGEAFNEVMEANAGIGVKEAFADLLTTPGPLEANVITVADIMAADQKLAELAIPEFEPVHVEVHPESELARLMREQAEDAAERSTLMRTFDAMGGGTPCPDCGLPLAMGCDCASR